MAGQYFGTDGIRGRANKFPMTAEIAMRVGMAAGLSFQRGSHRHRVVLGKDTRLSGYMIENAMVSGLCAAGMDVFLLGPIPTPAVAMLVRSLRADIGAHRARQEAHGGRRHWSQQQHVGSDRQKARRHGLLDHVAGKPRVLADDDAMAMVAAIEHLARRHADAHGDLGGHWF